jgi:hypothetical protein
LTWGVIGALSGFVAFRIVRGTWDPLLVVGVLTTAFLVVLRFGWIMVRAYAGFSPDWTASFLVDPYRPEVPGRPTTIQFAIHTKEDRVPHYVSRFFCRIRDPDGFTATHEAGQWGRGAHANVDWPMTFGPETPAVRNGRYQVTWYQLRWGVKRPILTRREKIALPPQGDVR